MTRRLVIVESPTKAKTLKRFLGDDYVVESSVGHVRDLPAKASEIPATHKKEKWARLGVDVEHDFKPLYVVSPEKKATITKLKKLVGQVDELLLATDEDREGEAISWHLVELLKPKVPVKRMVFHEITKSAILHAVESPREIDIALVGAQETRRIIDRLYGYEVSPILWRKVAPKLSAGRVQSVAIRMIVEREQARMRFRSASYWDLAATFRTADGAEFSARLVAVDGARIATGGDFDPDTGALRRDRRLLDEKDAAALRGALGSSAFRVTEAEEKPYTRSPAPPFTTSTLQQEGNRKLKFDAKRTMRAAQRLYESGYITYMRTDSVALSDDAIRLTRDAIRATYGESFLPSAPRRYRTKVKNAQEAHEAIRPAGERVAPVAEVKAKLGADEARVYELIWKRTMACQMKDAHGRRMSVRIEGAAADGRSAEFAARGNVVDFPGFLRAYVEGSDDPEGALADQDAVLPPLARGDALTATGLESEGHETSPPARLTEAGLVKALEESGIGRPSTYASIIDTIQRREYTFKKGTALVPTFVAFAVVALMVEHLSDLIDPDFTARMEDRLDAISRGEVETLPYLREFYFGNGTAGLRPLLDRKTEDIDPRVVCAIPLGSDPEGRPVIVRVGRYGPYLQRGEENAQIPAQICPDELTVERALELLAQGKNSDEPLGTHPANGEPVFLKSGRFGPYVQLGAAKGGKGAEKPKMVSLLKGMDPAAVTLETALKLLELPRTLGKDAEGRTVEAHLGRYGPYLKREGESRSLEAVDDLLTVGLDRALELFAREKAGRGSSSREPLKVFAKVESLDGADVKVMNGRYGPYVTDGDVNATVPKDADPAAITLEQALELLARQREKPRTKRPRRRAKK